MGYKTSATTCHVQVERHGPVALDPALACALPHGLDLLRNKRHAAYQSRLFCCKKGSRRAKRLKCQQRRAQALLYR